MICELEVNNYEDRMKLVGIVANSGYTVKVDIRDGEKCLEKKYFVVISAGELVEQSCSELMTGVIQELDTIVKNIEASDDRSSFMFDFLIRDLNNVANKIESCIVRGKGV